MNELQEGFYEPPTERLVIVATGESATCIYYDDHVVTVVTDNGVVSRLGRGEVQNAMPK